MLVCAVQDLACSSINNSIDLACVFEAVAKNLQCLASGLVSLVGRDLVDHGNVLGLVALLVTGVTVLCLDGVHDRSACVEEDPAVHVVSQVLLARLPGNVVVPKVVDVVVVIGRKVLWVLQVVVAPDGYEVSVFFSKVFRANGGQGASGVDMGVDLA